MYSKSFLDNAAPLWTRSGAQALFCSANKTWGTLVSFRSQYIKETGPYHSGGCFGREEGAQLCSGEIVRSKGDCLTVFVGARKVERWSCEVSAKMCSPERGRIRRRG